MQKTRKHKRAARRLFDLCLADGVLDEARARDVAGRLAASRRRGALQVLSRFQRLVRLDRDRRTAVVQTTAELAPDLKERVQAGLARVYGPAVGVVFEQDPALIGGMRIRVGSDIYDGSVRARLAALEARW